MSNREIALNEWVIHQLTCPAVTLLPLCGDASFRRYFRTQYKGLSYIAMDAPPEVEALAPFINAANVFHACGVHVPKIYAANQAEGFALLEDFGDRLLLDSISATNYEFLYEQAITELLRFQCYKNDAPPCFPDFDRNFMRNEMSLCIDWFITQYVKYALSEEERAMLQESFQQISLQIIQQPKVLIHRDYHSRNIMHLGDVNSETLGIIDFQDAMIGPYSYDLVSLGKDCYVEWPREQQLKWLRYYFERSLATDHKTFDELVRDYDYCGLQRHLKVLGIFSRLHLRDGKEGYLKNIPLTFRHLIDCLKRTGWLPDLLQFFQRIALP